MDRTLHIERKVPVDFTAAARVLRDNEREIVCDDPHRSSVELAARLAGVEVRRSASVDVGNVHDVDSSAVSIALIWQDAEHPGRFPTVHAVLELSALSSHPALSQLALIGEHRPPWGVLGTLGDAAAGHGLAVRTIDSLMGRIVDRLAAAVAEDAAQRASLAATASVQGHRMVLPRDD